jgi:protein translocase subunit secA 1
MLGFLDKRMVYSKQKVLRDIVSQIRVEEKTYKDKKYEDLKLSYVKLGKGKGEMVRRLAILSAIVENELGLSVYDEQLEGALVLINKGLAEMKTGEGKTLMSIFAISELALAYDQVHVVTANEYLAERDEKYLSKVYKSIGLTSGFNSAKMNRAEKQRVYKQNIVYSTASEFGFDYLRDRMVVYTNDRVVHYDYDNIATVIDEIDSILIDEARTPLILAQNKEEGVYLLDKMIKFTELLEKDDYEVDYRNNAVWLTNAGYDKFKEHMGSDIDRASVVHWLYQALQARFVQQYDIDYVLKPNAEGVLEVCLVDKNTGRTMEGRRYSNGLHQALEVLHEDKGVHVASDNTTSASITVQNYFRLYKHISGMTGTALSDAKEFKEVYDLDVYVIPTHKPFIREDIAPKYYIDSNSKLSVGLIGVIELSRKDKLNPILIGTSNLEHSLVISEFLTNQGYEHVVLNAKQDAEEARIIQEAGNEGRITVATNMAGRGSDIIVDKGFELVVINMDINESKRIDQQLLGRTGRQGAKGTTYTLVGLDDYLFKRYTNEFMKNLMMRKGDFRGKEIDSKYTNLLNRHVLDIVATVEGLHSSARKQTIRYDSVLNLHSKMFYEKRDYILTLVDDDLILKYIHELINDENVLEHLEEMEQIQGRGVAHTLRAVLLAAFDVSWIHHMEKLDALKAGIHYRAYGGDNPLVQYHEEAAKLYDELDSDIVRIFGERLVLLRKYETENVEQIFHSDVTIIR